MTRFDLLDAAQLLKHMLGLGTNRRAWSLCCLWYLPDGAEGDLHAAELKRFTEEIGADEAHFRGLSHQELFTRLQTHAHADGGHAAYLKYLGNRYF